MACAVPNQDRVIVTKFITSGAVPIIPSGSCAEEGTREIEEAEIVVNTRDKRVFTRAGNSIIELTNQSSGGAGTVTSVSVVTNQGVSGSVATATTTPAITLSLGALTGVTSLNGLVVTANTGVITTGTWNATPVVTTYGGTGLASYTQGDLLYYDSGTTLSKLAKSATATRYLSNTGASNNPAWAQVDLSNGVTGNLPVTNLNSGTSASASTFWRGDGTWASVSVSPALSSITAAGATNTIDNLNNLPYFVLIKIH